MKIAVRISVLILLLATGCVKKPLPAEEPATPAFTSTFYLDGQPVNLSAGVSGYSMTPSFSRDSAGIVIFRGVIRPADCGTCGWSLAILLRNSRVTPENAPVDPDTAFMAGSRLFHGMQTSAELYRCDLKPVADFVGGASSYNWGLTGNAGAGSADTYTTSFMLAAGRTCTTTLKYDDGTGDCIASHFRVFKIGSKLQVNPIVTRSGLPEQLRYSFSCTDFKPSYQYTWFFGDGSSAIGWNQVHTYNDNGGVYAAVLRVISDKKDTCFAHYQVPGSVNSTCNANFNATITPVMNSKVFGSVSVILTDPNGEVYSSDDIAQPAGTSFVIREQRGCEPASNGLKARSLSVAFNCLLKGKTRTINLSNGDAVIAVNHP